MLLETRVYCTLTENERVHIDRDNQLYIVARDAKSLNAVKSFLESKSALLNELDLSSLVSGGFSADFACIKEDKCQVGKIGTDSPAGSYALSRNKSKKLPGTGKKHLRTYSLPKLDCLVLMSSEMRQLVDDRDIKEALQNTYDPKEAVERMNAKAKLNKQLTPNDIIVYIQPIFTDDRVYIAQLVAEKKQLEQRISEGEKSVEQLRQELKNNYELYKTQKEKGHIENNALIKKAMGYIQRIKPTLTCKKLSKEGEELLKEMGKSLGEDIGNVAAGTPTLEDKTKRAAEAEKLKTVQYTLKDRIEPLYTAALDALNKGEELKRRAILTGKGALKREAYFLFKSAIDNLEKLFDVFGETNTDCCTENVPGISTRDARVYLGKAYMAIRGYSFASTHFTIALNKINPNKDTKITDSEIQQYLDICNKKL